MLKDAFSATIKYMQIMDENGSIDQQLMPNDLQDQGLVEFYKMMNLARNLDAKALSLQRQGKLATYAPLLGEEATQIGSAMAMRQNDFAVPNFRQHGVYIARGLPLEQFFVYWKGYEEGAAIDKKLNMTPVIVPVATQMPHAAGIAFAKKYMKEDSVVVAYVGDGGTSEGDFYEAINFAGVFNVPIMPDSASGVSITLSLVYLSTSPSVTLNTPPSFPMSSPRSTTLPSSAIARSSALFIAWTMFIIAIMPPIANNCYS